MICNLNIMKNTKKTDQEKNFEQKKVQIADKVELFLVHRELEVLQKWLTTLKLIPNNE